jgi:hypothetical protein
VGVLRSRIATTVNTATKHTATIADTIRTLRGLAW